MRLIDQCSHGASGERYDFGPAFASMGLDENNAGALLIGPGRGGD